jgi:hypothetical protein
MIDMYLYDDEEQSQVQTVLGFVLHHHISTYLS